MNADYDYYRYKVTHDNGDFIMRIWATGIEHGASRIMANEPCPRRSIKFIEKI